MTNLVNLYIAVDNREGLSKVFITQTSSSVAVKNVNVVIREVVLGTGGVFWHLRA